MRVHIGLGGNLGDREGFLRGALEALTADWGAPVAVSGVYETEAWGMPEGTPAFLNAVAVWEVEATPLAVWERLVALEAAAGRVREGAGYASRTLDCDVLAIEGMALRTPELTVPHPRLGERRFVLEPLAEVAPDLWIAGEDRTVGAILATCNDATPVRRTPVTLA